MSKRVKEPFHPGDVVVSSYRVPPFLADEPLVVMEVRKVKSVGRKAGLPIWRVRVKSGRGPEGWLDTETLTRI